MNTMELSDVIPYLVHSYSSHSTHFHPENILVDDPTNSKSRWTTASPQSDRGHWIMLQLERIAVLKSISFGKLYQPHPCNMKEFKVYIGMTPENLTEVLHSTLKNDSVRENFSIPYRNNAGHSFPTRFVKIEPISVYGGTFNTSIWHVALTGIVNEASVKEVKKDYDQFREIRVMQHILKHLRQRRLLTAYNFILSQSGIAFEHPLVSELYESIVLAGNWDKAESLLHDISNAGLFDHCLVSSRPCTTWSEIHDTDANGEIPSPRGGHAMCLNPHQKHIYLFGGWDGQKSLEDFWRYDIKEERWHLLSSNTSLDLHAPGPRSCHKMVYSIKTNSIFVLGRLNDSDQPSQSSAGEPGPLRRNRRRSTVAEETPTLSSKPMPSSEFYQYHCGTDTWERLHVADGPEIIFDHQMVIDGEGETIYVFGGRVVDGTYDYSGLYSYNLHAKKWRLLEPSDNAIPSRFGHSMIFEPNKRQLYIFAGEREEKFLSDLYMYDIATNTATEVFSDFTSSGGPEPCFTERAVIDPSLQEIYVFDGLIRDRASTKPSRWLYRYQSRPGKWVKMLEDNHPKVTGTSSPQARNTSPLPRYAHQVVYDSDSKTVYLHGGATVIPGSVKRRENNGDQAEEEQTKRLSDFWKMTSLRLSSDELIRRSVYLVRQQRFKEMCEMQPAVQTLIYLQNQVSEVVNHDDEEEAQLFRSLLTYLLTSQAAVSPINTSAVGVSDDHSSVTITQNRSSHPIVSPADTPDHSGSPIIVDQPELLHSGSGLSTPPSTANAAEHRFYVANNGSIQVPEDPFERKLRSTEDAVSQECFAQRTKTFEAILEFVASDAKQPTGSLLDLVDIDADVL